MKYLEPWALWAFLSAGFAALTAIFAKSGVENVNPDFATFIRTIVILAAAGGIVLATGQWQDASTISDSPGRRRSRSISSAFATIEAVRE